MADIFARQRQIVGSTADWATNDLTIGDGELAIERGTGDDVHMKIGDGSRPFSALPYFPVIPPVLVYKGATDPTAAPPAGAQPGWAYSATVSGTVAASWGAPAAGTAVEAGDLLAMDDSGKWNVLPGDIDPAIYVAKSALAADSGAAMVGFIAEGPNAQPRDLQAKARDFVNLMDFYLPTDPDVTNALERAIYTSKPAQESIDLWVPAGEFDVSRQIIPRRTIRMVGQGAFNSRLNFKDVASVNPTMKGAISFGLQSSLTAYVPNPDNYPVRPWTLTAGGADQSEISNLGIVISGSRPAGLDYGIWNCARLTGRDLMLYGCGMTNCGGNLIIGSGAIAGNSNLSFFENVVCLYSSTWSFIADGSDANAISFVACKSFVPTIGGFWDGSLLGNTYDQCYREGATATTQYGFRAISPGNTNKAEFVNCYNESDTVTVARWDIAPGCSIKGWLGAMPEALGGGKNSWMKAQTISGWVINDMLNVAANGDGFSLGSASSPASRLQTDGLLVRGRDGGVYAFQAYPDGMYITKDSIAILKLAKGAAIANVPTAGSASAAANATAINAILAAMRAGQPMILT